ncbi:nuclear transport factor 2 family protein [Streptomyces sp. SL13]|uniref:Nuclear transport factor 2 family protein n=1 Tax=Streptantibioticus silvisoli TaxID=2705255 RepID=A0AA90HA65_9ACTN|nr:nuclear transport factor 2 family protein [Streptantibioticus silvisoli]MDI5970897.1 nuclear transport factor 2 family protein [Streptantibioticus silvisoli]
MDNEKRMIAWCRMWTEDPSLAHDLMSDGCVQWSGQGERLDAVVGPAEQEQFVTAYQARQVNVYSPRVLIDAGDRFAYLWDVTTPDGQVLTGLDVNILNGSHVQENWTFVGRRRCELPGPGPGEPTAPATIEELARRWVRFRNGRTEPAEELVTGDFALFSAAGPAGDVSGPAELATLVERQAVTALTIHREPVVDLGRGRVAFLWTATSTADGTTVGGADVLTVRDGRFACAWSFTGMRPFRY